MTRPETWKPVDTTVTVEDVGTVTCHAEFDRTEVEGGRKVYSSALDAYVEPLRTHWTVTLTFDGRTITSPYSQGSAYDRPPTAASVLESLFLDARMGRETFAVFCGGMGYDEDSRSAEATWRACRDTFVELVNVFPGATFDRLEEWGETQ